MFLTVFLVLEALSSFVKRALFITGKFVILASIRYFVGEKRYEQFESIFYKDTRQDLVSL